MKKTAIFLLMLLAGTGAGADNSMRCGNRLLIVGDHQAEVNGRCGRPDFTERRTILRAGPTRQAIRYSGINIGSSLTEQELLRPVRSVVEVPVTVWVYNFGPRRFMREVIFQDGKILTINNLGYGY